MSSDERVLVIERQKLFNKDYFSGFLLLSNLTETYLARINSCSEFMKRGNAETNPAYKQLIPYAVLTKKNKLLVYQRAIDGYSEKRLQNKVSIGIGGHVGCEERLQEGIGGHSPMSLIEQALKREINEEIDIEGKVLSASHIGFLNDDSDDVGRVHFGLVYVVGLQEGTNVKPKSEIKHLGWCGIEELKKLCDNDTEGHIESWSRFLIGFLYHKFMLEGSI